jgi:acetyl-CoA acetyltransferase
MSKFKNKTAIVGIGLSDFSKDCKKTELRMICETLKDALDDAGLTPRDIDGIIKHTDDSADEHAVTSSMGMPNLTYFGETRWTGASCGMVMRAAMGIASGACHTVLVYRGVNGGSKRRATPSMRTSGQMSTSDLVHWAFHSPFGLMDEKGSAAMIAKRYMHETGATSNQMGAVAVTLRENGAKNPGGFYYKKPITMKDYMKSKMVVDPFRKLDCHEEHDAAAAFIVTTVERAKDMKQTPAVILGAAQGIAPNTETMCSYYRDEVGAMPEMSVMAKRLFKTAGVKPKDIQFAQLDDPFSAFVPMQLEALGFCKKGKGAAFCENGKNIKVGGKLPVNTSGGSLGEGHIHGMNHVIEAVRQIRGTSSAQVKNAKLGLVSAGAGGPTGGLILGR